MNITLFSYLNVIKINKKFRFAIVKLEFLYGILLYLGCFLATFEVIKCKKYVLMFFCF